MCSRPVPQLSQGKVESRAQNWERSSVTWFSLNNKPVFHPSFHSAKSRFSLQSTSTSLLPIFSSQWHCQSPPNDETPFSQGLQVVMMSHHQTLRLLHFSGSREDATLESWLAYELTSRPSQEPVINSSRLERSVAADEQLHQQSAGVPPAVPSQTTFRRPPPQEEKIDLERRTSMTRFEANLWSQAQTPSSRGLHDACAHLLWKRFWRLNHSTKKPLLCIFYCTYELALSFRHLPNDQLLEPRTATAVTVIG